MIGLDDLDPLERLDVEREAATLAAAEHCLTAEVVARVRAVLDLDGAPEVLAAVGLRATGGPVALEPRDLFLVDALVRLETVQHA